MKKYIKYKIGNYSSLLLLLLSYFGIIDEVKAQDFEYKGINYTIISQEEGTCMTKAAESIWSNSAGNPDVTGFLNIPESVIYEGKNYEVIEIGGASFISNRNITGVRFPKTLIKIGECAFSGCSNLKGELVLPDNLETIGRESFYACTGFTGDLIIPDKVTNIDASAFYACTGFDGELILSKNLINLEDRVFGYCSGLKGDVKIPDTVTSISWYAFVRCEGLTTITLSKNLSSLHTSAFDYCYNLEKFICPFLNLPILTSGTPEAERDDTNREIHVVLQVPKQAYNIFVESSDWNSNLGMVLFDRIEVIDEKPEFIMDIDEFEIKANSSKTIGLNLKMAEDQNILDSNKNSYPFQGFSCIISFPEGLTVDENDVRLNPQLVNYNDIFKVERNGQNFIIIATFNKAVVLDENFVNIEVNASKNITDGQKGLIKIQNPILSDSYGEAQTLENVTIKATYVNIPITEIVLTDSTGNIVNHSEEMILYIPEQKEFTITLSPEDVTLKEYQISLSQEANNLDLSHDKDNDKLSLKAVKEGQASLTLSSEIYNYSKTYTINVVYVPDLVLPEFITITPVYYGNEDITDRHELKLGETMTFTAEVNPSDATHNEINWSLQQDGDFAEINEDGILTTKAIGNVKVIAFVKNYESVKAEYDIEIIAIFPGDADDNKKVDVSDAITVGNYIVGIVKSTFCFANADVIKDNQILIDDQSEIINIALGISTMYPKSYNGVSASTSFQDTSDYLYVESSSIGQEVTVYLNNTYNYKALQGDITLPEGMVVKNVKTGKRSSNHILAWNVTKNGILKVVIYSLANQQFEKSDDPLLIIETESQKDLRNLDIQNIFALTTDSQKYALEYKGTRDISTSSFNAISSSDLTIRQGEGFIEVLNCEGKNLFVYDISGKLVHAGIVNLSRQRIYLANNLYIVSIEDKSYKVLVK